MIPGALCVGNAESLREAGVAFSAGSAATVTSTDLRYKRVRRRDTLARATSRDFRVVLTLAISLIGLYVRETQSLDGRDGEHKKDTTAQTMNGHITVEDGAKSLLKRVAIKPAAQSSVAREVERVSQK